MNINEAVLRARQWGRRTIAYAISVETAGGNGVSRDALDATGHRAQQIEQVLFTEALLDSGGETAPSSIVVATLATKLLNWVADRRHCKT
jgi:hypothetical protein